jgi:hypothetical protein
VLVTPPAASVLDLVDNLLTRGVVLTGDIVLGLAGVDLICVRLSALLCTADRLGVRAPAPGSRGPGHRPGGRRWAR